MMGFVLVCHGNGKYHGCYVAQSGSEHSYTPNLRLAQRYPNREAANNDKCGNETVESVESQLSAF